MFKKKYNPEDSGLEKALTEALSELPNLTADSEEYTAAVGNIEKLHGLRHSAKKDRTISPDVALTVGANLAGILLILNYERLGIVTSKALSFVMKTKA